MTLCPYVKTYKEAKSRINLFVLYSLKMKQQHAKLCDNMDNTEYRNGRRLDQKKVRNRHTCNWPPKKLENIQNLKKKTL